MGQAPFWTGLIGLAAAAGLLTALYPPLARFRARASAVLTAVLWAGWGRLALFHWTIWRSVTIAGPDYFGVSASGLPPGATGHLAVPLWIEGEKLFAWACLLALAVLVLWRRRDDPLFSSALAVASALALAAVIVTNPFFAPLPGLARELTKYFEAFRTIQAAIAMGKLSAAASQALAPHFQTLAEMAARKVYYYNTVYMWVHPPALFVAYAAFAMAFMASVLLLATRAVRYDRLAYDYAKLGYLVLTAGMLIGYPWALEAWKGESWWWSGKINMSLMMWVLYSGYLHSRLYLKRRGMWRFSAWLGVACFVTLVLTYLTTYFVPGIHSVAP
jgi:ABC-type transport system involved in cytochrome c biogenesis permease subunit